MSEQPNNEQHAHVHLPFLTIGCVGGGQLGRMMSLEAPRLNISMKFLDPSGSTCPAATTTPSTHILEGSLNDSSKLRELANKCDVVTVEIEHVGTDTLEELEREGVNVQPSGRVVKLIQDKFTQKEHFRAQNVPIGPYQKIDTIDDISTSATKLGLPLMIKSRRGGYDGKGNAILTSTTSAAIQDALTSLGVPANKTSGLDLYAEAFVNFKCEMAVMVVRSTTGETRSYPTVTAIQTDSVCRLVLVPARNVSPEILTRAQEIARKAISSLGKGATGVFGVELFLTATGEVLLNEVAPRPHNTGHYTQDACAVSQFENHLRAISGLPLGDTSLSVGAAAMMNILGAPNGELSTSSSAIITALESPRTTVHWYGKSSCRAGRKIAHINITADSISELEPTLDKLLSIERDEYGISKPFYPLEEQVESNNNNPPPLVGIIMGSSSDLPCMSAASSILTHFNIPHEVDIVSAHRTPAKLVSYANDAAARGIQCIIAGAGGAAHLPGMVAAMTPLPVIGVPIKTSTLNGQDSLLSIVQMPRGIPVATVAIGNAMNAGLLAVRILCGSRVELRESMVRYQEGMTKTVMDTSKKLLEVGCDEFLEGMDKKNQTVNV